MAAAALALSTGRAEAGPKDASYDRGSVSVTQNGASTVVNQSTNRAVIDWRSFDVGRDESVRFNQPGATSSTLNRVRSGHESTIAGRISAPGQVIIQNSNGVVFTETARVDVGSLIATAVGISRSNFEAGRLVFDQPASPDATVQNHGDITVAESGLAAFVAPAVANSGTITAKAGQVVMAAGKAATIDLYGDGLISVAVTDPVTQKPAGVDALIAQGGVIKADGGTVVLTAQAAAGVVNSAINMTGLVQARGTATTGGQIALVGGNGTVQVAGTIAAGSTGGEGGAVQVSGSEVVLAENGRINADGASGGDVVLRAEGQLAMGGQVSARGRAGGKGGTVDTSAGGNLRIAKTAKVAVDAPAGKPGMWLIDPASVTVVADGGTAGSIGDANGATGASTIDAAVVEAALAGGEVTLLATDLIDIEAAISGPGGGLQLIADGPAGRVRVDAPIDLAGGALAIRATSAIDLTAGAQVQTGGTVWLQTGPAGRITQANGSSIIAGSLAATAADVSLTSSGNNVGTLAGLASNGIFLFNQTNATGVTTVGTVTDPFFAQSIAGVAARTREARGSQTFSGESPRGDPVVVVLSAGGALFDTIVFTALPYAVRPGAPGRIPNDSSDYFVQQLDFATTGGSFSVRPSSVPEGLVVTAGLGTVVIDGNRWGVESILSPGPLNQNELQRSVVTGLSESLAFALNGATSSVTATFSMLFASPVVIERGQAQFFASIPGPVQIGTQLSPGGIGATALSSANFVEPLTRGRDPDTPADAVYRTSQYENPYVEDPYLRSYALGGVGLPATQLSEADLARIAPAAGATQAELSPAAGPQERRAGQHALRGVTPAPNFVPVNLGSPEALLAAIENALAGTAPGAGPASGVPQPISAGPASATSDCIPGSFLADFWRCTPTPVPSGAARQ